MGKMNAFHAQGVARCTPGTKMDHNVQSVLEEERVTHNGQRSDQARTF